jgi:hypothetical protein
MDPIAGRPQRSVLASCIIAKLTTRPGVAAVNLYGYYCAVRGVHPPAHSLGPHGMEHKYRNSLTENGIRETGNAYKPLTSKAAAWNTRRKWFKRKKK